MDRITEHAIFMSTKLKWQEVFLWILLFLIVFSNIFWIN
jgi:hypothetical protein